MECAGAFGFVPRATASETCRAEIHVRHRRRHLHAGGARDDRLLQQGIAAMARHAHARVLALPGPESRWGCHSCQETSHPVILDPVIWNLEFSRPSRKHVLTTSILEDSLDRARTFRCYFTHDATRVPYNAGQCHCKNSQTAEMAQCFVHWSEFRPSALLCDSFDCFLAASACCIHVSCCSRGNADVHRDPDEMDHRIEPRGPFKT